MCLGIPGQIVAIKDGANCIATVNVAGVRRDINIACVVNDRYSPADIIGDWVLVHVGFAMSRIDPKEAERTLQLLEELGEFQNDKEASAAIKT